VKSWKIAKEEAFKKLQKQNEELIAKAKEDREAFKSTKAKFESKIIELQGQKSTLKE
jgi:hypothetical protein